jgi:hypothetical protein
LPGRSGGRIPETVAARSAPSTVEPPVPSAASERANAQTRDEQPNPRDAARRLAAIDRAVFLVFCAACATYAGALFVGAMLRRTGGVWTAPVDATFVDFDFARSTARGSPFQWCEGNGYATGGGSFLYPIVLALGFRIGFEGTTLMKWAVTLAGISLVGSLFAMRRVFDRVGRHAKYLVPPVIFSVGTLDAMLFGGMEWAFFLGVFALAFAGLLGVERALDPSRSHRMGVIARATLTGVAGALLVLTRPEGLVCVLGIAAFATARVWKRSRRNALFVALALVLPGLVALAYQALLARDRTGEWIAAEAVTRLVAHARAWPPSFFAAARRIVERHLAGRYAIVPLALALVPIADARLRRYAIFFLALAVAWVAVASLTPGDPSDAELAPAIAWLLTCSTMGLAVVVSRFGETLAARSFWGVRTAAAGLSFLAFFGAERPRMHEAEWRYAHDGAALLDEEVAMGERLRDADPKPRRVLVDAPGAIAFAADLPSLDVSGVGGYHDLLFARAARAGLGATLEMLERVPEADRPDAMVVDPSQTGDLTTLFGRWLSDARATDATHPALALYRTDWHALDRANRPRSLETGERVIDSLDVGDVTSERAAGYGAPDGAGVSFHVLVEPTDDHDLFDAGRSIAAGEIETAELALPIGGGRLIARTAALAPLTVHLRVDDRDVGDLEVPASDHWSEPTASLPIGLPRRGKLTLAPMERGWIDYHVWIVATP